jgi:putative membrane-bound dehydrogenase-like protein
LDVEIPRHRAVAALLVASLFAVPRPASAAEGIRPVGADGKPLNLGFEDGTLKDWTAEGTAFEGHPIKGDAVAARRNDMKSGHAGEYWAGSMETGGDDVRGTLTSVPFEVTHRWASFLVAGGVTPATSVELVDAAGGDVVFRMSGTAHETLRPVVVDLEQQMGKRIYIRLVDRQSGGWGHVNYDEFLFHDEKPDLPNALTPPPPPDVVKYAGLTPEKAVGAMTMPEGFSATVVAAEPDVVQPIAFTIDHRGRIWVVEGLTYPQRAPEGQGRDRILIFEDADGDGRAEKKSVFAEGLNLVSGIEVGFGGVWVGAAPYLMFIPDKDGDDKPDAEPQVLLDGWGFEDTHETLNTFAWGPDGWLYGCHGVFTHSRVGKPGTPVDQRQRINAGIWRYHPTKHTFEVFAEGTSNPWGFDFDANGQMIAEACVIPHLWHIIQGARYQRQAGAHFNPFTFADIQQVADHVHYAGTAGPHAGNNRSDAAGGGHAHAGLMVYQGASWPEQYRGQIFIGNIHGQRINVDVPERKGSGFVGRHGEDFLNFNDKWSQVINFRSGPDGNVYFIDWYDREQCHLPNPAAHDRGNGRIFKVSYGDKRSPAPDLSKRSSTELMALQLQDDVFLARTARRLLQERAAGRDAAKKAPKAPDGWADALARGPQATALRALWTEHAMGLTSAKRLESLLGDKREYVAAWAIQLLTEDGEVSKAALSRFARLAKESPSPVVRLYLASALQRLPLAQRWDVLDNLVAHSEDAGDHNLPLMYWYAGEPLAAVDAKRAMELALDARTPNFLSFMVRRITAVGGEQPIAALVASLDEIDDDARRLEVLRGLSAAMAGQRDVPMPAGWQAAEVKLGASGNEEVRALAQGLSVTFGSTGAMDQMRKTLADASAPAADRAAAVEALVAARDASAVPVIQGLLADKAVRGTALRGLAAFDDPKTPELILKAYPGLSVSERRDALNTLASRPAFAQHLFDAVRDKVIPNGDITADLVRQLRNLADPEVDARVADAFNVQRQTPEEKLAQIARMKNFLAAGPAGDPQRGREVFARTCQQCHVLFDAGGDVGPNITGANRADIDYLLVNILDPNAVIPVEYRTTVVQTKDGRVITGIVAGQDDKAITLKAANETIVMPRGDVKRTKDQDISMMPEGLLDGLLEQERRDLIAYLQSPQQTPLPATPENAKTFFNGKDLTGWWGDMSVWSVDNGEIVGKSATGLKNNDFLKNTRLVKDFRLTLKVKLVPNTENSGIQFRSVPIKDSHEMKGYQADIGQGWWGKIYHESGRGLLSETGGDDVIKKDDWNTYEILAVGHRIRTAINGKLCTDLDDPMGELEGVIAVQVHSGGPTEVRFKDIELEVDPKPEMKTVK